MSDPRSSHVQSQPFPLADDYEAEEDTPQQQWTMPKLARMMAVGFNGVSERIDALAVRTEKLEADGQWKVWAVKVAKIAGPAAVGVVAARFPEVAKLLSALLQAMAGAP